MPDHATEIARFGVFELHLHTAELRKGGAISKLPPQPSKLLTLLVTHAGELVTREQIRQHLWGNDTFVDFEQGLNHCIRQIRSELNDFADHPLFIQTVPRRGYTFIAPVAKHAQAGVPPAVRHATRMLPFPPEHLGETFGIRRWGAVIAVGLISLAAIIALMLLRPGGGLTLRGNAPRLSEGSTQQTAQPLGSSMPNSSAQLAYIKGRFYWNKRTPQGLRKAIEYFQLAADKDPNSALAYAGLADTYDLMGYLGALPPSQAYPRATAAALRALELDNSLAEAHASLADIHAIHDWQWTEAEREYRRAIELKPRYATAHQWYASFLSAMGRHDEAIAEARRALDFDPLSLIINVSLGRCYFFANQYDDAVERFRAAIEMDPSFVMAHVNLGQAYEQKGMLSDAIAEFQRANAISDDSPRALAALAHAYAVSGSRSQALQIAQRLKRQRKKTYISSVDLALIYAGLNDRDDAFAWLRQAYEERNGELIFIKVEPRFTALRKDPKFLSLAERIGLPP